MCVCVGGGRGVRRECSCPGDCSAETDWRARGLQQNEGDGMDAPMMPSDPMPGAWLRL